MDKEAEIETNDMDKCIRLHCDRAYNEACAVWNTDEEGYWQENYKGIDDWEL